MRIVATTPYHHSPNPPSPKNQGESHFQLITSFSSDADGEAHQVRVLLAMNNLFSSSFQVFRSWRRHRQRGLSGQSLTCNEYPFFFFSGLSGPGGDNKWGNNKWGMDGQRQRQTLRLYDGPGPESRVSENMELVAYG